MPSYVFLFIFFSCRSVILPISPMINSNNLSIISIDLLITTSRYRSVICLLYLSSLRLDIDLLITTVIYLSYLSSLSPATDPFYHITPSPLGSPRTLLGDGPQLSEVEVPERLHELLEQARGASGHAFDLQVGGMRDISRLHFVCVYDLVVLCK